MGHSNYDLLYFKVCPLDYTLESVESYGLKSLLAMILLRRKPFLFTDTVSASVRIVMLKKFFQICFCLFN